MHNTTVRVCKTDFEVCKADKYGHGNRFNVRKDKLPYKATTEKHR